MKNHSKPQHAADQWFAAHERETELAHIIHGNLQLSESGGISHDFFNQIYTLSILANGVWSEKKSTGKRKEAFQRLVIRLSEMPYYANATEGLIQEYRRKMAKLTGELVDEEKVRQQMHRDEQAIQKLNDVVESCRIIGQEASKKVEEVRAAEHLEKVIQSALPWKRLSDLIHHATRITKGEDGYERSKKLLFKAA